MNSRIFLIFITVLLPIARADAQWLQPIDEKSAITFEIKNLEVTISGNFKGLEGTIPFDDQKPGKSSMEVSIEANTVKTGITSRDNHLRGPEFFDVTNFPRIAFKSDNITASGKKGKFTLTGKLTIKGITKDISFPFTAVPNEQGYLFEGSFEINRRDFKVGGHSLVMGDNVKVSLHVAAKKR